MYNMPADYNPNILHQAVEDALKAYGEESIRFNVLITGKTGVGKSTLVNSVFRAELADTSTGRPVLIGPHGYRSYEQAGVPVKLFDTEGIELNQEQQDKLLGNLSTLLKNPDSALLKDRVHMIWYCINAASNRCEEAEEAFINQLSLACEPSVPVVILLTQATRKKSAQNFKESLEKIFENNDRIKCILPVLAQTVEEDEFTINAYGLTELCERTAEFVPEAVKASFINSQKVNIDLKIKTAHKTINRYTRIASLVGGGSGALGIDDSIALLGLQCAMCCEVGYLFGLKLNKNKLLGVSSAAIGGVVASTAGKTLFSQAIRAIPIAGQLVLVVEGGVRAGIAASITKTIGEAFLALMKKLINGEIEEAELEDVIAEMLKGKRRESIN